MVEARIGLVRPRVERATQKFRVVYIDSFLQIQNMPPFNGATCDGGIHVITDFDGVISEGGSLKNVANLRTLSKIGERSKVVEIHTSRSYCDDSDSQRFNLASHLGDQFSPVSDFPILTWSSGFFLEEIIKSKNSDCRVSFVTGFQKIFGGNQKVLDLSSEVLNSGNTLVMIGSSLVDKMAAKNVYVQNKSSIKDGRNFFCYNTGHILI